MAYVVRVSSDLQLEEFRTILKERALATESITMTIAEQLLAEGKAQGVGARIEGCQDLDVLQHWLTRAVTAVSADQIFEG